MDSQTEQALEILSDFPKEMAATLAARAGLEAFDAETDSPKGWRDITGSGHLIVRGAMMSLERLEAGANDARKASKTMATAEYAMDPDKSKFYLGDNVAEVAEITDHILVTEMQGGSFEDALDIEGYSRGEVLDVLTGYLNGLHGEVNMKIEHLGFDQSRDQILEGYADILGEANAHYARLAFDWKTSNRIGHDHDGGGAPPPP